MRRPGGARGICLGVVRAEYLDVTVEGLDRNRRWAGHGDARVRTAAGKLG